jgi:hypothetical protein
MSDEHTAGDSRYDVTFHRAFASSCTITDRKSGTTSKLYEQDRSRPVDVRNGGHPKKHRIVLRGKNGKRRNLTLMIEDPEFAIHSIRIEFYAEGRDPSVAGSEDAVETLDVVNAAMTCPPHC